MTDTFNPQSYEQLPKTNAAQAVALASSLLAGVIQPAPTPEIATAVGRMANALAALQTAWNAKLAADPASATRASDGRMDNAWSILHERLHAYAQLPVGADATANANIARAGELDRALFPDGMAFLNFAYDDEWATSQVLLQRVAADGLQTDIDRLAGPEFLAEVKLAFEAYGIALGVTARPEPASPIDVDTPLLALRNQIARYVRAVLAWVDGDDARVPKGRAALAPIPEVRASQAQRRAAAALEAKKAAEAKAAAQKPGAATPASKA